MTASRRRLRLGVFTNERSGPPSKTSENGNDRASGNVTSPTKDTAFDSITNGLISIGATVLIAVAMATLAYGAVPLYRLAIEHHGIAWLVITGIINTVLLVFIILELVETAHEQLRPNKTERLSCDLVRKLLIIGILSCIRHILTIGAGLTAPTGIVDKHPSIQLQELGINTVAVLILIIGLILLPKAGGHDDQHDQVGMIGLQRRPQPESASETWSRVAPG
jgi:hypothetical protein